MADSPSSSPLEKKAAVPVMSDADKAASADPQTSPIAAQAQEERRQKPFPWPLLLALLIPLMLGGVLYHLWDQQEILAILRVGWIALCSIVPGLALMVVIGSLAQIRRRPILGFLSLVMGGAMLWGCWWGFQQVMEHAPTLLR